MNKNNRITLDMTVQDAMYALSEGNVGAVTALAEIVKHSDMGIIDLCHLDDAGIYGSVIWLGYKDVCNFDVPLFVKKIRERTLLKDIEKLPYYARYKKMIEEENR